ncbi:hypothetical protein SCP_1003130 [Sparassis crispa]|uniref:F-box domain-containing protein n=1 Tax=Sparassis crispa TaxID=139825 RepID=A0A401GXW7_9APHY|nr:hypothetical protein SCP_1003130 [Sparassis crispa]GBE87066.1 hypothetical protein SCP_1003130 [Sparassis crispa]
MSSAAGKFDGCATMASIFITILQNEALTARLLEAVLHADRGLGSLSWLARTCKALRDPALTLLWRDLNSFEPLVTLFPQTKSRVFGSMRQKDWDRILGYGSRVRSISYIDSGTPSTLFDLLEKHTNGPDHIMPNLTSLSYQSTYPPKSKHCTLLLGPKVQTLNVKVQWMRYSTLVAWRNVSASAPAHNLKSLSSLSIEVSGLYNFYALIKDVPPSEVALEHLSLVSAKGIEPDPLFMLWVADLPKLHTLGLAVKYGNVSASAAVEYHRNTYDTIPEPTSSMRTSESHVPDVKIPKFGRLRKVRLIGTRTDCLVFLRDLSGPQLHHVELELVPAESDLDWHRMCIALRMHCSSSLHTLRIHSPHVGYVQEPIQLEIWQLGPLPHLRCLEIDLPDVIFNDSSIVDLTVAIPSLEEIRLAPFMRFPHQGTEMYRFTWLYSERDSLTPSEMYKAIKD